MPKCRPVSLIQATEQFGTILSKVYYEEAKFLGNVTDGFYTPRFHKSKDEELYTTLITYSTESGEWETKLLDKYKSSVVANFNVLWALEGTQGKQTTN